ncbi:MAG: hypothetical protein MUC50_20245 [Myxococcota bacterium]|jgi:hypothetical protein|nr:hypothetical protein [Myxococcota bacterium]
MKEMLRPWFRVGSLRGIAALTAMLSVLFMLREGGSRPFPPVTTVRDLPLHASAPTAAPTGASSKCLGAPTKGALLLHFPAQPSSSAPVTLVALAPRQSGSATLELRSAAGTIVAPARLDRFGIGQQAVSAGFPALREGRYSVILRQHDGASILACDDFVVEPGALSQKAPGTSVWKVRRDWAPEMEDLYSAWIAKLFYVSPGAYKGWQPLHQATRDPTRNFLYGSLGLDEDNAGSKNSVRLSPDCADLPYHLRAYFAWKLALPMLINLCNRGRSDTGSRCDGRLGNTTADLDNVDGQVERFNMFVEKGLTWKVQTGNLRTAPSQSLSDFYTVSPSTFALRPGAVFIDPGGHTIVVSQVEPQRQSSLGTLYGVDAHPDRTVTHKAFGPGTFVFNHRVPTGGFKAFRPVVRDERGSLRFLSNAEIEANAGYVSRSSAVFPFASDEAFYNDVFTLLNPVPPNPRDVLIAKIEVLQAAMRDRAQAVQLGQEFMAQQGGSTMSMPQGAEIFETVGAWENYSTPARDLRCLLAIDDVMGFPKVAAASLARYAVAPGTSPTHIQEELTKLRDELLAARSIEYKRSDGSSWTLTLAGVVARQVELEMAYNPNDCAEIRWGAALGSEEMSTCQRNAPHEQRQRMKMARAWFANRRRPDQR